ncbi:hypothetical protein HU200_013463 [Digitaria exilis]|uniref:Uncharacterized protein n=1 Tax=Digitaria exilis TaxID=1010633 RepID=A0A835FEI6_9POAL|nr:hypothetical protein HU200_013463 [Digitaria exilis]
MAWALDALASYVQNMLVEMAKEEVHMLLGVSEDIVKMDVKLRDLKNCLADADRRNITDLSVQEWVRELRNAMYDATNILDLCQLKAMEQGPRRDVGCFNPLLFCMRNPLHAHDIGSRIKKLNRRLEEIKKRSMYFSFINLGSYEYCNRREISSNPCTRETSGELDELSVVGEKIEEDTRNLVEILTTDDLSKYDYSKIMVFAIVGVGGIGKTTLAQKIFNHDIIQQEFPKKIWLSVNQDFNETELLRRAITEAGGDHQSAGNTRGALERALKETLDGKKTFLVMDDVWNHRAWEDVLRIPMINASLAHGSRVLVTTRHDTVARGMMAKKPYHHVDKLEPTDAWLLLKKQVVGNESDEAQIELVKDIGMEIIAKCDGLPLAVKVMGGFLRQKRIGRRDWEDVLNDSIWSVSQMPEELNNAIYISYKDLQPCLKSCFLHFALLPKCKMFIMDDLVSMWISEGFVHETSRDYEEIGREYYHELIQRNLLVPDKECPDQAYCNMHDVVHLFAQYVARNEALVAHNSEIDICDKQMNSQKFIQLSLMGTRELESSKLEWCSIQAQTSLRTLISVGHIKIKNSESLLAFSNLRTLHVEDANFDGLAESLDQLKHLRYLSLARTNTSRLPENIHKMKFLLHINLASCEGLVKLPASISNLQQLRYLNISATSIKYIPRGFCGLTSLRKLLGFPAHVEGDRCSLEELGPLSHLTWLSIRDLKNVSSSKYAIKVRLHEKVYLRTLALICTDTLSIRPDEGISENEQQRVEEVFDELCPPLGLEFLLIGGYFGRRLPRWMKSASVVYLRSLRILSLHDLVFSTELPVGLCQLPCLEHLRINLVPAIKRVGSEFLQPNYQCQNHSFPKLQKLLFGGFHEWVEWEWDEELKAMPILEELHLRSCKLRHVPPGLAFNTRALKKILIHDVKYLRSLENFTRVVDLEVTECTAMERISNLPKLHRLVIRKCPKMKVLEGVPALQKLNLEDYHMETVPRYIKDIRPRHLMVYCTVSLLCSIATGKSGPEWDKFSHIQQVNAYANDNCRPITKLYVLYRRDPFFLETNITRYAIARARKNRAWFRYMATCPIDDVWPVGQHEPGNKRLPLCLRFRWQAFANLCLWLRRVCLHCNEATGVASSSDQWTEAAGCLAYVQVWMPCSGSSS